MMGQMAAVYLGTAAISAVIEAPKKHLPYYGVIGVLGWLVYLIGADAFGNVIGVICGTLALSLTSHFFARFFKVPVTIFLIPGILPLVPGANLYKAVYQYFLGRNEMASWYLLQTLQIAGGIAFAIFIVDSSVEIFYKRKREASE